MSKNLIKFLRQKDFQFIRNIGQGGTGKTILIRDETINEIFICKKYSPYYESDGDIYYENFLTEIKILHRLYHRNVVRVFNYYLYNEKKTGYILMDYIEGENIADFLSINPDRINDVFLQLIEGFKYLEENEILHRDIRPENILITDSGILKIIDFGFGKQMTFNDGEHKSITLNWRYGSPNEFKLEIYNQKTDIYFVGKLIEEIIEENDIKNFAFPSLLKSMTQKDCEKRTISFMSAQRETIKKETNLLDFSQVDKIKYQKFADCIDKLVSKIRDDSHLIGDISKIISTLENTFQVSSLEENVQNPSAILGAFIKGSYSYNTNSIFPVSILRNFIELLKRNSVDRQKVIINNLWQRFDVKPRYPFVEYDDDLPF